MNKTIVLEEYFEFSTAMTGKMKSIRIDDYTTFNPVMGRACWEAEDGCLKNQSFPSAGHK
jgi:hypothetical protein